jgi:guanylate kinase
MPAAPEGKDIVLEIDVQGAAQVKALDPSALVVFIAPPSLEELERRLRGRGDPEEKIRQRLALATSEEQGAAALGAIRVVNDDLGRAVDDIHALIEKARE